MKKMPSVLNCSIHSRILDFPQFSRLGNMVKCGKVLTTLFMALNQQLLQGLTIITVSLEVLLVGQEDILLVGTPVGGTITQIVEGKAAAVMAVGHILLKDGAHLMHLVACLVGVLVVEVVVAMELELQVILKVVHMAVLQLVVAQT